MNPQGHQTSEAGHERKDVDVISLALIAALLLLMIGLCLLVCWGILRVLNRERDAEEAARPRAAATVRAFPPPRLLVEPGSELRNVRARAATALNSTEWVDRPAGIASIPVRRAMELLVERGLPEVGAGQTRLQLMQARPNEPAAAPMP